MNIAIPGTWSARLYLDAIGSASVIAATILIVIATAVVAVGEVALRDAKAADACPAGPFATADYVDQRPGAPRLPDRNACI